MREYPASDTESEDPTSLPVTPTRWSQRPARVPDGDPAHGTPQVLARIPSLAAEEGPYEAEDAPASRDSRGRGSRLAPKILATAFVVLFLAALWGFVFKDGDTKDAIGPSASTREPFKPEAPAPNAPAAPRWGGSDADSANWQPGTAVNNAPDLTSFQPGSTARTTPDRRTDPAAPSGGQAPAPWQASVQSSAPQGYPSPADAPPSEIGPDWTTQPYPTTANRNAAPSWNQRQDGDVPSGAPSVARRETVRGGFAPPPPGPSGSNPIYNDAKDALPPDRPIYSPLPNWVAPNGAVDQPAQAGRQPATISNRPASLGERPPIDTPGSRADYRDDYHAAPSPEFRSPGPNDYRPAYPTNPSPGSYPSAGEYPDAGRHAAAGAYNVAPNYYATTPGYQPAPSSAHQGYWPPTVGGSAAPPAAWTPIPGYPAVEYGTGATTSRTSSPYSPSTDAAAARFDQTIEKPNARSTRYESPRTGLY